MTPDTERILLQEIQRVHERLDGMDARSQDVQVRLVELRTTIKGSNGGPCLIDSVAQSCHNSTKACTVAAAAQAEVEKFADRLTAIYRLGIGIVLLVAGAIIQRLFG